MIVQKTWYQSKTVWGALMTVVAVMAGQLGISIDGDTQQRLIDLILNASALIGSAIAIYGRINAVAKITK